MAVDYLGHCDQDLVGFNMLNSGYPLQIGVPTLVNDAVVIDTNSPPAYSGVVNLSIANELGMTAVFAESGTTTLTKTVVGNTLTWIPVIVTANDCGYDRGYYWEFRVYYTSIPDYSATDGGIDPDPCFLPNRSVKVCRFDARGHNTCLAGFSTDLTEITGDGTATLNFNLGRSPLCTGPVKITFTSSCDGVVFPEQEYEGTTMDIIDGSLVVLADWGSEVSSFPVVINYDSDEVLCYCQISAVIVYESSNQNDNLLTLGNNGTFSGLFTGAQFNTAGVLARLNTTFGFTTGVSGTALRTTNTTPVDDSSRPVPGTPLNPTLFEGSIIWQGDVSAPLSLNSSSFYQIKGKARMLSALPLIRANEEVHIDAFDVTGSTTNRVAMPYFSQYTPYDTYLDCGLRFRAGNAGSAITPFVRYVNTLASGTFTTLIGGLYLSPGSSSDWCDIELTRYYPTDPILCGEKYHTIKNTACEYNTFLGIEEVEECESVALFDNSDFGYEPGHDRSDFTIFRKITITLPDGSQEVISSVQPANEYINPASQDVIPGAIIPDYDISTGGFYVFTLCNIPTFNSGIAYPLGSNVVFIDINGNMFYLEAIGSQAGFIPFLTTGWENVWSVVSESDVNEKYCDTQTYIQLCGLDDCINEYKNKLICNMEYICSQSLCENDCAMNYFELMMIKTVTEYLDPETEEGCWDSEDYRNILNYVNKLCSTCNCQ